MITECTSDAHDLVQVERQRCNNSRIWLQCRTCKHVFWRDKPRKNYHPSKKKTTKK